MTCPSNRNDVIDAIEREMTSASRPATFVVRRAEALGPFWQLDLDHEAGSLAQLDESLEGYAAWWVTPAGTATADVLAVVPDPPAVTLRFCTAPPPTPGSTLRIYPPVFLEALRAAWLDPEWSQRCMDWCRSAHAEERRAFDWKLSTEDFAWLRRAQRDAFGLPGWSVGFLWGPPGTGKTTTLGAVLAQVLVQQPDARILLTSTTNNAVDLALVSIDQRLEELAQRDARANEARDRLKRIGNHFVARHYEHRKHLLPTLDEELVRRLVELETRRPDPEDVIAYAAWRTEVEQIRAEMRQAAGQALARASVAALTTTFGAFALNALRDVPTFDLLVIDEASQVGLAHMLALSPLARSVLLAGDPKQLGPIVQSEHPAALQWLGASGFDLMRPEAQNACFLDEQSRMSPPICHAVSQCFYDGRLRVAEDALADAQWNRERDTSPEPAMVLHEIKSAGQHSAKYGGPIRYDSAVDVVESVTKLLAHYPPEQLVVLTPFRAQRRFIRRKLKDVSSKVMVSTVHRSQGAEYPVVLFDWVSADNPFLMNLNGHRLMNVALSRACKQLHLFRAHADMRNPVVERVCFLAKLGERPSCNAPAVSDYVGSRDFPANLLGRRVRIGEVVVDVIEVSTDRSRFVGIDVETGNRRTFSTQYIRDHCPPSTERPPVPASGAGITASDLLANVGLREAGRANWGQALRESGPGIYIIEAPDRAPTPLSVRAASQWLDRARGLMLGGRRPTPTELVQHIQTYRWVQSRVLYIGQTQASLDGRVRQFYRHRLGCSRPHRGGHWIKLLEPVELAACRVVWVSTSAAEAPEVEGRLLRAFAARLSALLPGGAGLAPRDLLPFANLRAPTGDGLKPHGIEHADVDCQAHRE